MKSLQEQINEFKEKFKTMVPSEKIELIEKGLRDQKINEEKVLKVGDTVPDFSFVDVQGNKVVLSEELLLGNVVLTFYRGGWCPYCNLELRSYESHIRAFEEKGVRIIALSPEKTEEASRTASQNELSFTVGTDYGSKIAKEFGIVFALQDYLKELYEGFGHALSDRNSLGLWELPIPATYVIGKERKIKFSYVNLDYRDRLDPVEVLKYL